VEGGQDGLDADRLALLLVQVAVDAPSGHLAVVGRLDVGAVSDQVSAGEQPRTGRLAIVVHVHQLPLVELDRQRLLQPVGRSGPVRRHHEVALDLDCLVVILDVVALVVLLGLPELQRDDLAVSAVHLLQRAVRDELDLLRAAQLRFGKRGADLGGVAAENDGNSFGPAPEAAASAVHRHVASAQHQHLAVQLGQPR